MRGKGREKEDEAVGVEKIEKNRPESGAWPSRAAEEGARGTREPRVGRVAARAWSSGSETTTDLVAIISPVDLRRR